MHTPSRFHIHADSGEPTYRQLIRQVKHAMTTRALKAGDRMPTVRGLARDLGVNPNTVARAYRELEREGLLEAGAGRGTFVKALPNRLRASERRGRVQPFVERLVSEGRLLGLSDAELRGLVQRALREHPRPARFGGPA